MHAFRIVNVFTVGGDRFSGNPLCVFEDARGLTDDDMQQLARQMNLSETTFVLPSSVADARVRIFTPGFEMPFAGHPTLGTAHVVGGGRDVTLEMIAGTVAVTAQGNELTLRAARAPVTRPVAATRAELGRMVGLPDDAVCAEPRWVSTGVEQLVIPIATAALVAQAKPVPALIEQHGYSETRQEAMAYLVARDTQPWTVRFFFTSNGAVLEDPATGSACANLGGYLLATGAALPIAATLTQGTAIHRPSRLGLHVTTERSIYVSGTVHELGRGVVELP
jgi:PhzF family phenazine biosynthesis protein